MDPGGLESAPVGKTGDSARWKNRYLSCHSLAGDFSTHPPIYENKKPSYAHAKIGDYLPQTTGEKNQNL